MSLKSWITQVILKKVLKQKLTELKEGKGMFSFLDGKKSYLTGFATIIYGWVGMYLGMHDVNAAVNYTLGGLALISGKSALTKLEKK